MTAVLNVLLLILKWLGILLLVILGLLLLVVVAVLLAPIRYKGKLAKKEAPEEVFRADGLVSWLNPFLRVSIRHAEKKLRYTVRLMGLCLLDSEKPKKEKSKKETAKKAKKKKSKKQKERRKKKETGQSQVTGNEEGTVTEAAKPEQTLEEAHTEDSVELAVQESGGGSAETTGPTATENGTLQTQETSGETEKKASLFSKIKAFIEKVKAIPEKIMQKVRQFLNTLKLLWYKKEKVVAFFEDELHILALGKSWKAVKQLLGHMLPGKIKGHVEFGTGDPESTGKALGVLGVLYAAYGKGLTIVPDFYEKRLVAELKLKGRIRCGTVLVICLKLIRDKQVKRFYSNWKKLLEILKQKAE